SMLISVVNSLTLSPALTALLLKPHDKNPGPPLPWPVIWLAGGWAGWELLAPWISGASAWFNIAPDALPWVGAVIGAVAAGLIARPLNRALGAAFRAFNRGFDASAALYTAAVGKLLRVSAVVV